MHITTMCMLVLGWSARTVHRRALLLCSLDNHTTFSYGPPCHSFVLPPSSTCSLVLRGLSYHVFLFQYIAPSFASMTIRFCNYPCSFALDRNWDWVLVIGETNSFKWSGYLSNFLMVAPPIRFPITRYPPLILILFIITCPLQVTSITPPWSDKPTLEF